MQQKKQQKNKKQKKTFNPNWNVKCNPLWNFSIYCVPVVNVKFLETFTFLSLQQASQKNSSVERI